MASANVDLVRSIFADWERGDFSSAAWAHPKIEYVWVDGPAPGSWTGLSGMAQANRDLLGALRDWRVEADEYRELDDDRVFVLNHYTGRGRASGLEIGQLQAQGAMWFQICDGKVTRHVVYWDRERALADLGLTPETG